MLIIFKGSHPYRLSMRSWFASLVIMFLIPLALPFSHAEFVENSLTIIVSTNGIANVIEKINTRTTVSSIKIPSISNKISNILATIATIRLPKWQFDKNRYLGCISSDFKIQC